MKKKSSRRPQRTRRRSAQQVASLTSVVAEIGALLAKQLSVEERTNAIRQILAKALPSPRFRMDCLEAAMADQRFNRGTIHLDPQSRFSLCLFYWAPRFFSPLHEHRNWTVTGVLHGTLDIRLYRKGTNDELVEDRVVQSARGDVGALVPPCIHSVGNSGDAPTVSLHVFGPTENKPDAVWFGEVKEAAPPAWRPLKLWATAECAAAHPSKRAEDLLERIFAASSVDMRELVLDRLSHFAPARARRLRALWKRAIARQAKLPETWPGIPPGSVWSRGARVEAARRAGAEPTSTYAQGMIQRAMSFPMADVVERYRRDYDVGEEDSVLHEREVKRYLALAALYPDNPLGMAGKADDLWHTFIIFTREYHRFCMNVAGYYIHHRPTPKTEPRELGRANYQFFHDVYERVFGESPPATVWPSVAGPSRCASGGDPLCGCIPCESVPCNNRPPPGPNCNNQPACECPSDEPVCECPPE